MSLLTKPEELKAPNNVAGMLYGQPGSRKTTTALSAPNPVLLDFDRGLHRVDPQYRRPSLQVESYDDVLKLFESGELDAFEVIVVDTAGKLIDRIAEYLIKKNPKNGNGRGSLSQQGWGEVKMEFGSFVKRIKLMNKSVIFVAHESEEKVGEDVMKRPDIAGSARKDVVKELDFMGYMELRGDKPVINFNPTDKYYAKNSLGLDGSVHVPDLAGGKPNIFLAQYIFKASDAKIAADTALRKQYQELITGIDSDVAAIKDAEGANKFYGTLGERAVIWDSVFYTRNKLNAHIKEIGVAYDKVAKKFVKAAPATKKEEPASEGAEDTGAQKTEPARTEAKKGGRPKKSAPPAEAKKKDISDEDFPV